ncbi:BCD family MFS transporter [cf. Phormidesmis sp. LEGE 11477]|uniref:BCD family MFS transporter n=1 Tax=cf. Phormidesmis sp. LEGE 11477 TaxID=1828680 RepID=UPI0018829FE3|nr:BCD family MFS transporter [cf. Phormidesmis sp. LEGE 11477]MBE9063091.1 BCD family MFS transporter [cf. Phormidesmis sp. LEGE 11477]
MASSEISISPSPKQPQKQPQIGLFSMVRLGLFNMGLGIMSLLTLGVLNRVMIDELQVPALATAGVISVYQFMAPIRVWFGQLSDAKPLLGHHRSGYIWLGIGGMAISAFVAVQVMWRLGEHVADFGWGAGAYPWAGLLAAVFALYGIALSATTPFTALLVDVSDEKTKSKIVGIGWSMLMLGIVAGVAIINIVLGSVENASTIAELKGPINRLFIVVPAIVITLTLVSTVGIEKRFSRRSRRSMASDRDDSISFAQALKVLTASRQTGLFFCFLLVLCLSLFTQNPVLEPYGSQIFGMTIQQTTTINAFFGMGTLIGIIGAGFVLMPMLGKKQTVKLGCGIASVFLLGLIAVGLTANPMALNLAVGLFGLASGVLTTGSIVLMLDLTAAETAGTFIGAWSLAQAMAQGGASLLGGGLLSLGKVLTGASAVSDPSAAQLLPAYGLVFAVQAVGMWIAIALVGRVDITEFQLDAKQAISAALENDLD